MMWNDGWGAGQWIAMSLMMVAFWGVVVVAVVALIRATSSGAHTPSPPSSVGARRTLDERFARGEIEADEYTQRRDLLGRS